MTAVPLTQLRSRVTAGGLGAHVVALALVLLACGMFIGTRAAFFPDEGATIIQARLLADGRGWADRPALLHQIDPSGSWYALDNSDRKGDGFTPFSKHPVYAVLAAGAYRVARVPGIVALSAAATLLTAWLSALLARRFHRSLAVPAFWTAGVVSPLLFDSFLATGTTLGVALTMLAVLAAAHLVRDTPNRPHEVVASALIAAAGVFGATLIRSEGTVFAIALALAAAGAGVVWWRLDLVALGGASFVAGFGARLVEAALRSHILGAPAGAAVNLSVQNGQLHTTFLSDRLTAFLLTWLNSTRQQVPLAQVSGLLLAVVGPALVWALRRRRADVGLTRVLALGAILAAVGRFALGPSVPIPGLIIAFPMGWTGVWLLGRPDLTRLSVFCLACGALFAGGVLLTQYSEGGSAEWGGRYFAMALPVVIAPILLAYARWHGVVDRQVRHLLVATVVIVSVTIAGLAVVSQRQQRRFNGSLVATIDRFSAAEGRDPVVVSPVAWVARLSWRTYDRQQWLHVPPADLSEASTRLTSVGVKTVTFVSEGAVDLTNDLPGWTVVRTATLHGNHLWRIWLLTYQPRVGG